LCEPNNTWICPVGGGNWIEYCGTESFAQANCDQANGGVVYDVPPCSGGDGDGDGDGEPHEPEVEYNPATGQYEIDADFFEDVADGTLTLEHETTTLTENGNGYYVFDNIAQGSLADACGLEDDDIALQLNGQSLHDDYVLLTIGELQDETDFTLKVTRNGRPKFLYYTVE
jgi:hypothetical protein